MYASAPTKPSSLCGRGKGVWTSAVVVLATLWFSNQKCSCSLNIRLIFTSVV